MFSEGVIHPKELAMLTRVLNDFCQEHDIIAGAARETTACMIVALYRHGYQTESELIDVLDNGWVRKH
jgi:hypothetical protein